MKKAVLLDLDGTLTDPYKGISRCIIHALDRSGVIAPGTEELKNWIGPPLKASFAAWFESIAVNADAEQALAYYRERFSTLGLFENEVYEGIPKLLSSLVESGTDIYLATSKPAVYARQILRHFDLEKFFFATYGSELDGRYSDKKELLGMIMDRHELTAPDCVMVGDRRHDIDAARYHGMASIGVLWGYGSEPELIEAGAEQIFESIDVLASALLA